MLADLAELVACESSSYDPDALARCREVLESLVERRLGPPDERALLACPRPSARQTGPDQTDAAQAADAVTPGDVLTMTYRGTAPGTVALVGHYDTVWPTGTGAHWPLAPTTTPAGRRAQSGPGTVDMKAGLVVAIWALRLAREAAAVPTVMLVMNGDEEIGSVGSHDHIAALADQVDAALVFESSADGAVKTGRKGIARFEVRCEGIEAHAGNDPEAGASAISALAELIGRLDALADPAEGTTVNVGLIDGGSGVNVVAGRARAQLEVRVTSAAERERIHRALAGIAPADPRVSCTVTGAWHREPMQLTDASAILLDSLRASARGLGAELADVTVGGGSDANILSAAGVPVICGLGPSGGGDHARSEHVDLDSILEQTALVSAWLQSLETSPLRWSHE